MPAALLDLDSLLTVERRGWDALCRSEGGDFYGDLMTPEGVMLLVNGAILDRATVASTLNGSPAWSSYSLDDARLIPTGDASAALIYRASAIRDGEPDPFVALMSSHYALVEGEIRLALYQQTTITH